MSVHHRSSSIPEAEAPYRPISQDESEEIQESSALQVGEDEDGFVEDFVAQERAASHDARIGWIHLILGCAVLLPWNGAVPSSTAQPKSDVVAASTDHRDAVFPNTTRGFVAQEHVQLVPLHNFHGRQFRVSRACNGDDEAGTSVALVCCALMDTRHSPPARDESSSRWRGSHSWR